MGLIEKLEEIKTKVENYYPGGGGDEDYGNQLVSGVTYLMYGITNDNLCNLILDNLIEVKPTNFGNYYNSIENTHAYWFQNCKLNFKKFTLQKSYYNTDHTANSDVYCNPFKQYKDGNYYYKGEFGYRLQYTFKSFTPNNDDKSITLEFKEDLPCYLQYAFQNSKIEKIKINKDSWHIIYGLYAFSESSIKELPTINLDKCHSGNRMFYKSAIENLKFTGRMLAPVASNGSSEITKDTYFRCFGSGNKISLIYMFDSCTKLKSIKNFDITYIPSGVLTTNMFNGCTSLTELDFSGTEQFNININLETTGLDATGLMNMLNTLPDISNSTSRTLTIGDTKLALLTEEQQAEFAAMGYTLA